MPVSLTQARVRRRHFGQRVDGPEGTASDSAVSVRLRMQDPALTRRTPFGIISGMTKMMDEVIEVLRELPEERQQMIVRAILDYASHDTEEA